MATSAEQVLSKSSLLTLEASVVTYTPCEQAAHSAVFSVNSEDTCLTLIRRLWLREVFIATSHATPTMSKPFLDSYGGQTIQQLIAMKDSHRIDSLVLAVEQALGGKSESELSEPERVVLAVEAMEREVNNGGYEQFFGNTPEFTGFLVHALELIGCPKVAAISADAIASLELPAQPDRAAVERTASELSDDARERLGECDSRYYANDESIEQYLFAFIAQHQHEIRIPHAAYNQSRQPTP